MHLEYESGGRLVGRQVCAAMDVKKINEICYDRRVQYVRKRLREVVLVRYLKDTRCP